MYYVVQYMQLRLGYVIDYLHANLRFGKKKIIASKLAHNRVKLHKCLSDVESRSGPLKESTFFIFLFSRISTSSLGDTVTMFKCFHFAFWQNEIETLGYTGLIQDMQFV